MEFINVCYDGLHFGGANQIIANDNPADDQADDDQNDGKFNQGEAMLGSMRHPHRIRPFVWRACHHRRQLLNAHTLLQIFLIP